MVTVRGRDKRLGGCENEKVNLVDAWVIETYAVETLTLRLVPTIFTDEHLFLLSLPFPSLLRF